MKILITGSSSKLAKAISPLLSKNFELVPLGRKQFDIPWTLGICPDPKIIEEHQINAVVHFAWSLKDRKRDWHLNIGGTAQLSSWCNQTKIPFLFISTMAVHGQSDYGRSKLEAEKYVIDNNGFYIRPGLVMGKNKYTEKRNRLFQVIPKSNSTKVPVCTLENLAEAINCWLSNVETCKKLLNIEIPIDYVPLEEIFRPTAMVIIRVPLNWIETFLAVLSRISLKARNYHDGIRSLKNLEEGRKDS